MEKTALETQIGGSHYKNIGYQPIEFFMDANLNTALTYAIKYVSRYPNKNPDDLDKARHCLDIYQDWVVKQYTENQGMFVPNIMFENIYRFTKQFDPVVTNAIQAIINCSQDYNKYSEVSTPVFQGNTLALNITEAKIAINQVEKYYETRTKRA